jgi:hypothetical protein
VAPGLGLPPSSAKDHASGRYSQATTHPSKETGLVAHSLLKVQKESR